MKRGRSYEWIPLWVEKWLWGSTRIELDPAERSVWVDLMVLGSKDDGYIRANQSMPYLDQQIAGILCIDVALLRSTIDKCIKYGKLRINEDRTLYIINWKEYSLTERHKRRVMSGKADMDVRFDGPTSLSLSKSLSSSSSLKEGSLRGEDEKAKKPHNQEDIRLVQLLIDLMQGNNPDSGVIKKLTPAKQSDWINQCRLLREADERTVEQIEMIIRFSQTDDFWRKNILSMGKLREKWDRLWMKASSENPYAGIQQWLKKEEEKDGSK